MLRKLHVGELHEQPQRKQHNEKEAAAGNLRSGSDNARLPKFPKFQRRKSGMPQCL